MKSIESCVFKIRQSNRNGNSWGQSLEYHCWCCYCTWWAILQGPFKAEVLLCLSLHRTKEPCSYSLYILLLLHQSHFSSSDVDITLSEAVNSEVVENGHPCIDIFSEEIFTSFLSIGSISSGKDRSIFANVHSFLLKLHSCKALF